MMRGTTPVAPAAKVFQLPTVLSSTPPVSAVPTMLTTLLINSGLKQWVQAMLESRRKLPEWSTLTRRRRVDVLVGMTLQCLLLSLHVLVVMTARAVRIFLVIFNTVVVRVATLLGLVRPLRLLRDSEEVREQLESATLLRVAGFNLVLFEGLQKNEYY